MNTNNFISFQQYFITNRYTHQAQADWNISTKLKLNTTASFQDYQRNTDSFKKDYRNNTNTPDRSAAGYYDVSAFQTWFLRSTATWVISSKVSLQPCIDIKYDKTSGQRIAGNPSITDYSFFVSSEFNQIKTLTSDPVLGLLKIPCMTHLP